MSFKLPFPKWTLNSDASIEHIADLDENGSPNASQVWAGRANHVMKAKQELNAHRELVRLSGTLIIPGDPIPNVPFDAELYVHVANVKWRVYKIRKTHNPDASIFSTELDLI